MALEFCDELDCLRAERAKDSGMEEEVFRAKWKEVVMSVTGLIMMRCWLAGCLEEIARNEGSGNGAEAESLGTVR